MSDRFFYTDTGDGHWDVHDAQLKGYVDDRFYITESEPLAQFMVALLAASDDPDETFALFQRALLGCPDNTDISSMPRLPRPTVRRRNA